MKYEPILVPAYQQTEKPRYWRTESIAAVCFLAVAPFLFLLPVTHDAIWQVWIGRQILGGAELYTDIIEVNPPLWFWMAVPVAAVGEAFGIGSRLLIIGFFVASIGLSLFLTPDRYRLPLLAALVLVPLHDFGQREHFTLISTVPYVFLIEARASGKEVRYPTAIGLFAAFGFALKPHFALVPLALEVLVWSKPRIRPETVALGCAAAAYAIAVVVFAPAFLTDIVPMVRQAYGSFKGVEHYLPAIAAFAMTATAAFLGKRTGSPVTRALLIAGLAFLPAFFLQGKGWTYHSIPARGLLFVAIAVELMRVRKSPIGDGLLATAAFLTLQPIGVYRNDYRAEMERHLAGIPAGSSIIVLASNPSMAWPMVEERGLVWKLREFSLWQLAATLEGAPQLEPVLRRIVEEDLAKRPDLLVIDRRRVFGPAAKALVPPEYLSRCTFRMNSRLFESYACNRPNL